MKERMTHGTGVCKPAAFPAPKQVEMEIQMGQKSTTDGNKTSQSTIYHNFWQPPSSTSVNAGYFQFTIPKVSCVSSGKQVQIWQVCIHRHVSPHRSDGIYNKRLQVSILIDVVTLPCETIWAKCGTKVLFPILWFEQTRSPMFQG